MNEAGDFDQYIFSDGKLINMICNYAESTIDLRLQIRKQQMEQVVACGIRLRFENVTELDVLEDFSTSGNYSNIVFIQQPDKQFYLSFDPYGNSGEPNESDNFVIRAQNCIIEEIK